MKKSAVFFFVMAITVISSLLLLSSMSQATLWTYSYVGPDFNEPSPLPLPYEAGDHVEGFITIDDDYLDPSGGGHLRETNFGVVEPGIVDFSFSDGVKTIDYADLPTIDDWDIDLLFVSRDLVAWNIFLSEVSVVPVSGIFTYCGDFPGALVLGSQYYCGGAENSWSADWADVIVGMDEYVQVWVSYEDTQDPSVWNRSMAAVPEPATLLLLGFGLAGLGVFRKKLSKK